MLTAIPFLGFSQCKGFTKKECLPVLEPYLYNGQLNSAILNEGDVAELLLTFYGGQDYRILVCSQDMLGTVEFKLFDTERNEIFSNKEHNLVNVWDFNANSTQQLIVQVKVPAPTEKKELVNSGCVSILVGFKENLGE
ncbi:MAG: hypothetical protein A2W98_00925 [Bacteroidetes bacterium GWF2_33_38]|nr:MAG: hypothetical protein A2W98_00925 [Bacteroidetes bacterium GWF2_33_38]OFY92361.1 MAG: hypothetical protein A2236_00915 [Bacteroidetes bacterium RIFOXYA2_FULL_33_7]